MTRIRLPGLPCLRLAPRLTLLMLFVLLTIIGVDLLSRRFSNLPDAYLFEKDWLADQVLASRATLAASPPAARPAIAQILTSSQEWLDISILPGSEVLEQQTPLTGSIRTFLDELTQRLGGSTSPIVTTKPPHRDFSRRTSAITVVAQAVPARLSGNLGDKGRGDITFTVDLKILVPLPGGQWLMVTPRESPTPLSIYLRIFVPPVFGILMILLASAWTARSLLAPLKQLSSAAEKLGRERHVSPLPEMRIPEYQNIAKAFSDMQVQVKRFVDDRTHMLAAISHDLRTSLTRITLLSENIHDQATKKDILNNIQTMETMINEYLYFSRGDAIREEYSQTDLASITISVCDTLNDLGKSVEYLGPDHAVLVCQPSGMRRALTNLIENACTYGEQAKVRLADGKDRLVITISDKGPGVPDHLVEQALTPFQRLETSRNRNTGGTGLGLSIARDIIHAHGGEITLSNPPEGGLAVTIGLPKPRFEPPADR